jgi:glycosyltransferase involved in cell wall biosynthesis
MFVRSGPLDTTPAVARYMSFLRGAGFGGSLRGLEYGFRERDSSSPDVITMRGSFRNSRERVVGLLAWQVFQVRALLKERPELVQFCDVFSAMPALVAKYVFGARLIFDIRDNAKPSMRHRGWLISEVVGAVESLTALASDAVVVVNNPLKASLPTEAARSAFVIPNVPLTDQFDGFRFSETGPLVANLAGFVSFRRNLEVWCAIQASSHRIKLDLYGDVADAQTAAILAKHSFRDVKRCSHREAIERMRHADVVSLMYDPSIAINRYATPNKYFEALMLGKPVICAAGMRLADELIGAGCGLAVEYGDQLALSAALERLSDLTERRRMGAAARELFEHEYLGAAERTMRRLYQAVGVL